MGADIDTDTHTHTYIYEVKWSEVAQSCPTLGDPMDCGLPGSSVHGIFQARMEIEWVAISSSKDGGKKKTKKNKLTLFHGEKWIH